MAKRLYEDEGKCEEMRKMKTFVIKVLLQMCDGGYVCVGAMELKVQGKGVAQLGDGFWFLDTDELQFKKSGAEERGEMAKSA